MKTHIFTKSGFKTVFCCARCLEFVKFNLIDVYNTHQKVCLPCSDESYRKSKKIMKAKVIV